MPSWVLKSAVQKLLSFLPAAHLLNRFFQVHLTRSLNLTGSRVAEQMGRCALHLDAFGGSKGRIPERVLEIGTGWHPILPLGFHLCGCREIRTVDRAALLTRSAVRQTLDAVGAKIRDGKLALVLPRVDPERAARLLERVEGLKAAPGTTALEEMGILYKVGDAACLPENSADLVVTNSVLEHLEEAEIRALLRDLLQVTDPDGVASHFVDLRDHYAAFDRRIGIYNFLRFSDRAWSLANSRLHWQNRFRISDYRRFLTEEGWILREESSRRGAAADLGGLPLAPRFRRYSTEDLLVFSSWIRAVPGR